MSESVLPEKEWRARAEAHQQRVRRWTEPHRARQQRGQKHPVLDFLFTYYSFRPSHLQRWQPGFGVTLTGDGAREFLNRKGFVATDDGVTLDPYALGESRRRTAEFVLGLLTATRSREPVLNCFGLHEWAMVYRAGKSEIRHSNWPLRLGSAATDEVVESMSLQCTHHDAFRFFTEAARPRNALQPQRTNQAHLEQPGCLHANMDVFKWSYKLDPFVPAELIADCFELAVRIRELDMRASPYDLRALGYSPVAIETPQGRAEYVRQQRCFADEAAELRRQLIDACRGILAWAATPLGQD